MKLYEKKDHLINRNPNLTQEQKLEIINVLNKYPNLEKNIDWNKSNTLTYEDFKLLILDKAGKTNSQAKKKGISGLTEGEDYDLLYSKDGESLYAVYTHLASKTLASNRVEPKIWTESLVMDWDEEDEFSGRKVYKNEDGELVELKPGAKWCISMNSSEYWDDYTSQGIGFYFWFREDNSLEDYEKKIAISVDIEKKNIIDFTYGNDNSRYTSILPDYLKNILYENIDKQREKLYGRLEYNSQTGKYDYKGNLTPKVINNLKLLKMDNRGFNVFNIEFGKVYGNFNCSELSLSSLIGAPEEVEGSFDCTSNILTSLEYAPKKIGGSFYCMNNRLTSLNNSPKEVGKTFDCSYNLLTSLEGAPQIINGDFDCSNNDLSSLKGAPKEVYGDFLCNKNRLTSLKGSPSIVTRAYNCSYNKLTSLEYCPSSLGGYFICSHNDLETLEGCPKKLGNGDLGFFDCSYNLLTSLEGAPKEVDGNFDCRHNKLTSLKGAPKRVGGWFDCIFNIFIKSMDDLGEVSGMVYSDFE